MTDLEHTLEDLRRDLDQERRERQTLELEFDLLSSKLRFPGTKFLVDLEYLPIYDAKVTIAHSSMVPGALVETLPGALHALYHLSAYATTSTVPLMITDGTVIVPPANTFSVALQRRLQTSPTRIEVSLVYYNFTGADREIAVKVWRRLGMGGASA